MTRRNVSRMILPLAMLAAGRATTSVALGAAHLADSEQVSKLLSEANSAACQPRADASTMAAYSTWDTDWTNHKDTVIEMRGHVNAVGRIVTKLDGARASKEDHESYRRWERSYGEFYRSIALLEGAKTDQVKAELQDGLLRISVPVSQVEKKSRQVPIEARTAAAKA